jgi:putative flippase GtrA
MWTETRRQTIRQLVAFGAIGIVSTIAYAALYLGFRQASAATVANAAALVITAVANTAANRRLTFGVRDSAHLLRDHAAGLVAFALALAITTSTAAAISSAYGMSHSAELVVLVLANGAATILRFLILRRTITVSTNVQTR